MSFLASLGSWVRDNETLLSGLAAMIVLAGVVVSLLGTGFRRLKVAPTSARSAGTGPHGPADPAPPAVEPASTGTPASDTLPRRITFKSLSAPSRYPTKYARSGGIRIAYNDRGAGPPTILMAPGIISHLNILDNLPATRGTIDALARFARVVTFDKRGQGLSDPTISAPNLEERTDDIRAVLDDAAIDRAVLLGFSEGGPMCLQFAYSHPDRVLGLVLVGTTACWLQSDDHPIGLSRQAMESLTRQWGRGTLREIFFPSISREQLDDDTYRAFEKLITTRAAVEQLVQMMIETDVRPLLPQIQVPALVVHFAGDLAVPTRLGRALADGLPNAEFLEVNSVDHADLSQSPEAVERIREFCERVTRAGTLGYPRASASATS